MVKFVHVNIHLSSVPLADADSTDVGVAE